MLVWHRGKDGRLYESRFRAADLPEITEKLLGVMWNKSGV